MKKSSFTTLHRVVILAVFLFSTATFGQAQTFLGTAGDHLWSNEDNWLDRLKPTGMFAEVTISSDVIVDEDVSIGTLNNADNFTLTILSGKTLIVNTAIDWGDNNFILEDKAQLVHRDPIQVTIKKNNNAHNDDDHLWDLIASPVQEYVIPSTENGILTDPETAFALYSFDDDNVDWINYKEDPFVIENGKSYLYANAYDTTLVFEGTTLGYSAQCNLSYHAENEAYAGCNFIGNPLPCNAFIDRSYYILSEESNSLIAVPNSATRSMAPCSGIIVNSNGPDDSEVLFNYMPYFQYLSFEGYIEITAAKSDAPTLVLDQALLSFNEGDDLAKFSLFENSPRVYFTHDNKDLAILSIDSVDVQPLKFKAEENGNYTLHFNIDKPNLAYLHLIDNMTGANIDLLTTPNYSFNATSSDYATRFKLIFDPHFGVEEDGPSTSSGTFAYYADGCIIINDAETCHGASLQITDLTGRTVVSETINNRDGAYTVSTRLITGVYLLRLTNGSRIRTQKIVVN